MSNEAPGTTRRECRATPRLRLSVPTVLIVEDEPAVRGSLARYLAANGYAVQEATNLDQALAAVQRGGFQAAILDVRVPDPSGLGRSGLGVLTQLRERIGRVPFPVIVFTGYPLTDAQQAIVSFHRARLVYKPQKYQTLLRYLEQPIWAA